MNSEACASLCYAAPAGKHFRAPNLSEAEEADQQAIREIFSLCFSGAATLDDAITSVVVDRDMLRHLLVARPKMPKAVKTPRKEESTPLKRRLAPFGKDARQQTTKKPRSGECFDWMDGKCRDPNCRWKHECARCGDRRHDSRSCTKDVKTSR